MAENSNVGAAAQGGAEGSPSQPVSPQAQPPIENPADQLLAALESRFAERFDGLSKNLNSQIEGLKQVQGNIDRSQNTFKEQLAKLAQYEKQGYTREEAIEEMQRDEANAQWRQSLEKKLDDLAGRLAGGGTQANGQQNQVAKVFESIGLDTRDPRVASALLTQYKDANEVELAAYRLQRQIQQSPNPNPAQSPSLPGGQPAASNLNALAAEYDSLAMNPSKNFERMSEIQKELERAVQQ